MGLTVKGCQFMSCLFGEKMKKCHKKLGFIGECGIHLGIMTQMLHDAGIFNYKTG